MKNEYIIKKSNEEIKQNLEDVNKKLVICYTIGGFYAIIGIITNSMFIITISLLTFIWAGHIENDARLDQITLEIRSNNLF